MIVSDMERFRSHRVPLARGILARGWNLVLAAAGAQDDAALRGMGIEGVDLPEQKKRFDHIKVILSIRRVLAQTNPDLVHAVTLRQAFYTGVAMGLRGDKTPTIYTIAGLGSVFSAPTCFMRAIRPFLVAVMRCIFKRPHVRLIFQNDEIQKTLIDLKVVAPEQTYLVRGSGVDVAQFSFSPAEDTEMPIVLFGGRLLKDKGVREFVEAARIVRGKGIAARFVLAGDFYAANPHSLDPAQVRGWVNEGVVEWNGPSADMVATLRDCALAVLPSYHEGLPKFLLEAAATGRAIVTTDIPGCRDVVEDGANGILVPVRDVSALAEAIEKLLGDAERRRAMGIVGRKVVEREFSAERIVEETLAVYNTF